MASDDNDLFSFDASAEPASAAAVPDPRDQPAPPEVGEDRPTEPAGHAGKRVPRRTARKAAAAPSRDDAAAEGATQQDPTGRADEQARASDEADAEAKPAKKAARKVARRVPRKSARNATEAVAPEEAAQPDEALPLPADSAASAEQTAADVPTPTKDEPEPGPEDEAVPAEGGPPVVPSFGLLFKAPEPTETPRRRRASTPAATPAVSAAESRTDRDETLDAPAAGAGEQTTASTEPDQREEGDQSDTDDGGADVGRKRRRRGGKGRRGRGGDSSGEENGEDKIDEAADSRSDQASEGPDRAGDKASGSGTGPAADGEDETGETGSSRRRTRRRRRSGPTGDGDEPPGTTTRVREPRKDRDEVTSVKGSTRLEAKKQRRREGREAGRRRTIITEAEFLARRESVERVMVVRHREDRTQIGVLEDGVLVEHYVSRDNGGSGDSMAGNVYLGRIQNVLPSMEAAFVDIGKGRNAVLYAGEVNWDAAGLENNNRARRIENALSSGQSVLVQVTKDPIGHKGARLTSQVSLPGRYLVYVPDGNMTGISRKLPDTERGRLKKILREIVPENAGVIVRTAAEGASEDELKADVARLTSAWEGIQATSKSANAPALLHGEPDLTVRVIRDVFNEDFASLVVAGEPAWSRVSGYVNGVAPDLADRVTQWTGETDLFTHYRVDEQIAKAMDRKVWLPSGGSLVIDRTEAMTVVDVNTGKFVGSGGNLEETVTKNNIEAAEELVRQLRLRDIGGIIVIDFIDMVLESNRDLVVRRLLECLGRDRTKHQVAEVTSLGLVQMTRKRVGAGLIEVFSENCELCNGRGIIVHADPVDRPAGNSGGGNSGGGSSSAGGSNDSNRGTRSRRGKGGGRDTSPVQQPEQTPHTPTGPTPAQIAAAAHAAAMHVAPHGVGVAATAADGPSAGEDSPVEAVTEIGSDAQQGQADRPVAAAAPAEDQPAPADDQPATDQPATAPGDDATPGRRARGKRPRVIAPAGQPPAVAQPVVVQQPAAPADAPAPQPTAEPAPEPAATQAPAVDDKPGTRPRRKRARVVAPAGPPPGASGSTPEEFGQRSADQVG